MKLEYLRKKYKNQILEIAKECNVDNVRVFGSVARGEAKKNSDIDFLVHVKPNAGWGICDVQCRLEDLLKTKIDVLSDQGLNLRIKDRILNEAVLL